MDYLDYLRFALALGLVLGLIGILAWMLRRGGIAGRAGKGRRLSVVEAIMVGPRHRLLLVRRDQIEHLLLIGPNSETVVERAIAPPALSTFRALVEGEKAQP